jgi:hypothetical protein
MFRAHSAHHQERQIVLIRHLAYIIIIYYYIIIIINQLDKLFKYIYFLNSLHVSSTPCSSSGETNCINTSSAVYQSMKVTAWYAGQEVIYIGWYTPDDVLIQFVSPDDEHCVLETFREFKKINILRKCVRLAINRNYTEMHGQRNIKKLPLQLSTSPWK